MYSLSQLEAAGGSRAAPTSPPTPGGTPPEDLNQSTEVRQSPETLASAMTMVRPLITKRGGARGASATRRRSARPPARFRPERWPPRSGHSARLRAGGTGIAGLLLGTGQGSGRASRRERLHLSLVPV